MAAADGEERMNGRILIVDDELHVAQILGRRLAREGHEIETVRDGLEALERLRAGDPPDMVISDLQMPRMDGLELALAMAEDPALSSLPIVMLTSRGHRADETTRAKTNIVRLVAKPFSAHEMVSIVGEVLSGGGSEAA